MGGCGTIGSRFWLVSDFNSFRTELANVEQPQAPAAEIKDKVTQNSTLTSFLKNGRLDVSNESVRTAVNKAAMFSAVHVLNDDERAWEVLQARANAESLGLDVDAFVENLLTVGRNNYQASGREADWDDETMRAHLQTAMRKLLVMQEVSDCAAVGGFDEVQRASLGNAALGLAELLRSGDLSENAVLALSEGSFFDVSNCADVLKLAAASARRVKEMFIDRDRIMDAVRHFEAQLREHPELPDDYKERIQQLRQAAATLIQARERATAGIKTDFQLTDPTGECKDDKDFQTSQINAIRESLRAFRYDLDRRTNQPMGKSERFRRWCDNLCSTKDNRIDERAFRSLQNADDVFNRCLARLRGPQELDEFPDVSVTERAQKSTKLSHLANDAIRYYFSGEEQRKADFAAEVHGELDVIAKRGGKRSVSFEVGPQFILGANLGSLVGGKVELGAKFKMSAKLSVPDGGGPITVTYSYGGKVYGGVKGHAGATGKLGSDANGPGADVEAGGSGGAERTFSRTYATLDDFIQDTNGSSLVMQGGLWGTVAKFAFRGVKMIGHGVMLGMTGLGFRIHKSRLDQVAYAAHLREDKVLKDLDGLLLRKKNMVLMQSRKATEISLSGKAKATGKVYESGDPLLGVFERHKSNHGFHGSVGGEWGIETFVSGKTYRTFADSLDACSPARLENLWTTELEGLEEENDEAPEELRGFVTELRDLLDGANDRARITEGLKALNGLYDRLEATATGRKPTTEDPTDQAFWSAFARRVRLCSIACATLVARGTQLNDEDLTVSLKAARAYLGERMSNPAVTIPPDLYESHLLQVDKVFSPPKWHVQGEVEVGFDFGEDTISNNTSSVKPLQFGMDDVLKNMKSSDSFRELGWKLSGTLAGKQGAKSVLTSGQNILQHQMGAKTNVKAKVNYTKSRDGFVDARPWMNESTCSVEVDVTGSMPVRVLFEVIARAAVKHLGGEDEMENSRLGREIFEDLKSSLIYDMAIGAAKSTAVPLLAMSVAELAVKSEGFRNFLVSAGLTALKALPHFLNGDVGIGYDSTTEHAKTIRVNFQNGRLASLGFANTYSAKTSISAKIFWGGFSFDWAIDKSETDYSVFPKPSVNTLLGAVADRSGPGDTERLKHFFVRNKKGILRLMRAASLRPADQTANVDGKYAKDRQEMKDTLKKANDLLEQLGQRTDELADEAADLQQKFQDLRNRAENPREGATEAERLDDARELFTIMTRIFYLQARASVFRTAFR